MIEVVAISGLATVQDAGRPGRMHEGIPPGGALVPALLARANAGAHNAHGEAAVEVLGALTIVSRIPLVFASDDCMAHPLRAGETWTLACGRARVVYLAVRGGVDVPRVLGGRSTLLVARLGGHEGRPLRRGDVLRAGDAPARKDAPPPAPDLHAPVRVAPMVRGAIQVPASGEAIVLGPDHPTTGGYPVLATVVREDIGGLLGRAAGASVRFAAALAEG